MSTTTTVSSPQKPMFGLCRDCKHWLPKKFVEDRLHEYPRTIHPANGWNYEAVCIRIQKGTTIYTPEGWINDTVVETNANFGCRFFEQEHL